MIEQWCFHSKRVHCKIGNEREREMNDGSRKLERDRAGRGGEKEKRNDINNDIIEFIERFLECRDQKYGRHHVERLSKHTINIHFIPLTKLGLCPTSPSFLYVAIRQTPLIQ